MINHLKKFIKILKLFGFCLLLSYNNQLLIEEKTNINSYKDLWTYCRKWIDGEL